MHTPSEAHPFRDGTAGTEAKRRKLLSDRRDDLATMNHEIRRVYVARASALSGHLALFAGGALLVLASCSPGLAESLSGYLPGPAPAPLSTLLLATWVLAALAYLGGRALAEHRFNVAMSRAVLPTDDLHVDVARLSHEAPDAVGRRMARRLETPSRLGSMLATGLVMPATFLVALLFLDAAGYPPIDSLEYHLAGWSTALYAIALLALGNALWIGFRPNLRSHSLLALNIAACALVAFAHKVFLILLPAAFILAAVHASKARAHSRQNARIDQEGAPLRPVFSLRKRIAAIVRVVTALPSHFTRDTLIAIKTRVKHRLLSIASYRPGRAQIVSAALLIVGAAAIAFALAPAPSAQASASAVSNLDNFDRPPEPAMQQSYAQLVDERNGVGLLLDLNFANELPIDATGLLGGVAIPIGWRATITLTRVGGDGAFFVQTLPAGNDGSLPRQLSDSLPTVTIEHANCGPFEVPLELSVSPYGHWADAGSAQLRYHVQMELVGCSASEG